MENQFSLRKNSQLILGKKILQIKPVTNFIRAWKTEFEVFKN